MNYKPVGFIAIGVVAGFLIASYFNQGDKLKPAGGTPASATAVVRAPVVGSTESDQRVEVLTGELEAMRQNMAATSGEARDPARAREAFARREELQLAAARQHEVDQLTAAGFSPQRVDWIRKRREEIVVKQQQEVDEARAKGARIDSNKVMTYMLDPDLDLREDMGDAEYEKYRLALGKSDGVGVSSVLSTSNAEIAGLKAGDEILSYDGKRVYNIGMLDGLTASRTSTAPALAEVRRDGQTLLIAIPKGRVGIRNDNMFSRAKGGEVADVPK